MRLFLDTVILTIIQQRNLIDHAAKMNLLAYSSGHFLDQIGALLGVTRLSASSATTTIVFTLDEALGYDVTIPAGTRVSAADGKAFATINDVLISAGDLVNGSDAQCTEAGDSGNGYVSGQVNKIVDVLPFGVSAVNVTQTTGGSDTESDEAFRERIQIAPESFSVAGPKEAYKYFARTASSDIIDVAVIGPPDTDYVEVLAPVEVHYTVAMKFWVDMNDAVLSGHIQEAVDSAVQNWILWQQKALGRDINPSELIHRVMDAGAKRCEVTSPVFTELKDWETANCVGVNLEYGGLEKG